MKVLMSFCRTFEDFCVPLKYETEECVKTSQSSLYKLLINEKFCSILIMRQKNMSES